MNSVLSLEGQQGLRQQLSKRQNRDSKTPSREGSLRGMVGRAVMGPFQCLLQFHNIVDEEPY